MATEPSGVDHRRPAGLDLAAGLFLLATVVLHVVAMFPTYTLAEGSLASQTDQAVAYAVLAAGWALALAIGLTGPHRTPVAAALAVGVALTEMGFRGTDLGQAFHDGTKTVSTGLWLMEVAWVVGAVGALLAVLAARSRHASPGLAVEPPPQVAPAGDSQSSVAPDGFTSPIAAANGFAPTQVALFPPQDSPTLVTSVPAAPDDATATLPSAGDTSVLQITLENQPEPGASAVGKVTDEDRDDAHERLMWTVLVVVLAAVVAGTFLPAWDHESILNQSSGQAVNQNEGNAFAQPWEMIVGTVAVSVVLLALPAVAVRLRNKAVGAAAVVGGLIVMASQLASAVALADVATPADFGVSPAQVQQYGLVLSLKLTGWFTLEALATYALFATVMVWATLRVVQANSPGTLPSAPDRRNSAMPFGL